MARVVRSDGSVEHDWIASDVTWRSRGEERVLLAKADDEAIVKAPSKRLFDHWQAGGLCRSTEELDSLSIGGSGD